MRKLISNTFLTLDGVMQGPGGPGEDDSDGFTLGGWSVNYWDDTMNAEMAELMGKPFDLVLGRKTYDIFASYWPKVTDRSGDALNDATKYVASRGRPALDWDKSQLIEGDVAEGVAALKTQDGRELQVHGSGDLIQTLLRHGLLDEMRIWIFPVIAGPGKRLFAGGAVPAGLSLTGSKVSSTGVLLARYVPAGEVKVGSF